MMRWLGWVVLFVLTAFMAARLEATEVPRQLKVPAGTRVELRLLEPLTSATAEKGQKVRLEVSADVAAGGVYVLHAGTPAEGVVTRVRKAIAGQQDPVLEIAPTRVLLPGGRRVKLANGDQEFECGDHRAGCAVSYLLMGVLMGVPTVITSPAIAFIAVRNHIREKRHEKQFPKQIIPNVPLEIADIDFASGMTLESHTLRSVRLPALNLPSPAR